MNKFKVMAEVNKTVKRFDCKAVSTETKEGRLTYLCSRDIMMEVNHDLNCLYGWDVSASYHIAKKELYVEFERSFNIDAVLKDIRFYLTNVLMSLNPFEMGRTLDYISEGEIYLYGVGDQRFMINHNDNKMIDADRFQLRKEIRKYLYYNELKTFDIIKKLIYSGHIDDFNLMYAFIIAEELNQYSEMSTVWDLCYWYNHLKANNIHCDYDAEGIYYPLDFQLVDYFGIGLSIGIQEELLIDLISILKHGEYNSTRYKQLCDNDWDDLCRMLCEMSLTKW